MNPRDTNKQVTIYVEGDMDAVIVQNLLIASELGNRTDLVVCGGKQSVKERVSGLKDSHSHKHIALIDADLASISDSAELAQQQLGRPSILVFAAVPCIEAWLFADEHAAHKALSSNQTARNIERLPLPELIPYPKQLACNVFGKQFRLTPDRLTFLREIDVRRAAARSPSLRVFLSGVSKAAGLDSQFELTSLQRSVNRDVFSTLLRELPASSIVWRTLDGSEVNAQELAKYVLEGTDLGKQYVTEVLRIARDLVVRRSGK